MSSAADAKATEAKIQEYTQFLEAVLKPQMKQAKQLLDETEEEISEYTKLMAAIQQLYNNADEKADPIISMNQERHQVVDLGYRTVYCKANVESATTSKTAEATTATKTSGINNKIYVNVGLGFHTELEPAEAAAFCLQRIDFLKANQLHPRQLQFTKIHDHFQSSVNILQELEKVKDHY